MVFVTGATGLVGSHLLYFLAESGQEVTALRRSDSCLEACRAVFLQYPEGVVFWKRIRWVEGDVLDKGTLESVVAESDCIYHCAAVVSFHGKDRGQLVTTNLRGTENVVVLALKYGIRLCYVSSIAALGDARNGESIDETTPETEDVEHSVYSHSKGDAEKIVWQYVEKGLNAVIVNPSVILGAGMWGRSSTRLFMTAMKGVPFYTKGGTGYVDVRDVCRLMIRLAQDRRVTGERFVLNGENCSYRELFLLVAQVAGKRGPFIYMAPWFTGIIWRMLAIGGKLMGKQPGFTRETARSAHRRSYYSSRKILDLYPGYRFYTLPETVQHIYQEYCRSYMNGVHL